MRSRQLSLLPKSAYLPREHGGLLRSGKRKTARAVSTRDTMHVVLRSSRAKGAWSMLHPRHQPHIDRTVRETARRHGLRLYRYANVGNHLHLLVRAPTRTAFKRFLREITGVVAVIVTGAKKGNALERPKSSASGSKSRAGNASAAGGVSASRVESATAGTSRGFWDYLPYTRIVTWGRDFRNLELYFTKNIFEAAGLLTRKLRRLGYEIIPLAGWGVPEPG